MYVQQRLRKYRCREEWGVAARDGGWEVGWGGGGVKSEGKEKRGANTNTKQKQQNRTIKQQNATTKQQNKNRKQGATRNTSTTVLFIPHAAYMARMEVGRAVCSAPPAEKNTSNTGEQREKKCTASPHACTWRGLVARGTRDLFVCSA